MSLETLPPELLLAIADSLDANALYSLVLTCRRLNHLLTPSLYALPLRSHHLAQSYGPRALLSAATRRDAQTVEKMLKGDILKSFDWEGRRKLDVWLFCTRDSAMIEMLLLCGMDPKTLFENGDRPLLCKAAGARNSASVRALLAAPGIHVNAMDPLYGGETALLVAVQSRSVDVVEILCQDERTNVNFRGESSGRTALHYAVDLKSLVMVRCLLERREIEVDARSWSGETALCMAVGKGDFDMTELLLAEAGALVDLEGRTSTTRRPLHFGKLRIHLKIVRFLMDWVEAEIHSQNVETDTPLGHARSYRHRRVARLLKRHGAVDHEDERRGYLYRKLIGGKGFICFS